jgi:hypothetical protein
MQESCKRTRDLLSRDLFEELAPGDRRALEAHVSGCPDCAREREALVDTVDVLRSAEEREVPRHFFVFDEGLDEGLDERRPSPWRAFRRLSPAWQGGLAAAALGAVALLALTATRLSFHWEGGVLLASIGEAPRARLTATWKDEILTAAEERSRTADLAWASRLRGDLERSLDARDDRVEALLASALTEVEDRVDLTVAAGARRVESDTRIALARFRQLVNAQRQRDLTTFDRRLDGFATRNRIQSEQTELLMTAMFGPAEPSAP